VLKERNWKNSLDRFLCTNNINNFFKKEIESLGYYYYFCIGVPFNHSVFSFA
jgi:hypothetical protein